MYPFPLRESHTRRKSTFFSFLRTDLYQRSLLFKLWMQKWGKYVPGGEEFDELSDGESCEGGDERVIRENGEIMMSRCGRRILHSADGGWINRAIALALGRERRRRRRRIHKAYTDSNCIQWRLRVDVHSSSSFFSSCLFFDQFSFLWNKSKTKIYFHF